MGTTMSDRTGLKIVGFVFAAVTLVVTLATCMVVKGLCRRRLFAGDARGGSLSGTSQV